MTGLSRRMLIKTLLIAACYLCGAYGISAGPSGELAPDFPPGVFSDNQHYSLEEMRGRVVVLFFYEAGCPRCAGSIPERNAVVEKYRGKPVVFLAIGAGDSAEEVAAYKRRTGLDMPIFVDRLSLMEKRYDTKISLKNIWQLRVIGPDSRIVGYRMDEATIDQALAQIERPYDPGAYHEELAKVVKGLNYGEYKAALRELRRYEASRDEQVKASAEALRAAVVEDVKGWKQEADAARDSAPVEALKKYLEVAELFPREAFGQEARAAAAQLKRSEPIKDEIAASRMYAKMYSAIERIEPAQVPELAAYAQRIAEKYPDTPTGRKAAALAEDLGA